MDLHRNVLIDEFICSGSETDSFKSGGDNKSKLRDLSKSQTKKKSN